MGDLPTEPLDVTLNFKSIGIPEMDSQLQSLLQNVKNLNSETLKYQQIGSASTGQIDHLKDQISESQKMLDMLDRMARSQGANTDALSSYRKELLGMTQDLSNVKTFQSPISSWLGKKYGSGVGDAADHAITAGKNFVSQAAQTLLGRFDITDAINQGLNTGTQLVYGYGDLAKRMAPDAPSAIKWGQNLSDSLQGYGYDDMTVMQSATQYAGTTGRMDTADFTDQMKTIAEFGSSFGLDLQSVTQNFSSAYASGLTGIGQNGQMSPEQFANLIGNAVNKGDMNGSESEVMSQVLQITQMGVSTDGQAGSATQVAGLLDNVYKTSNQALINQAPQFFQAMDNGMSNPGGGEAGQMMMLSAINKGAPQKLSYWQQQMVMQADAFTPLEELGGKTKFETVLPQLYKETKGEDPDQQAVLMGKVLNINPNVLKKYLPTLMNSDGTLNLQAANQMQQQLNQKTTVPENDADQVRNNNNSKDHAANVLGMIMSKPISDVNKVEGDVINKYGGPLIGGIVGLWAAQKIYSLWNTGKNLFQRSTGEEDQKPSTNEKSPTEEKKPTNEKPPTKEKPPTSTSKTDNNVIDADKEIHPNIKTPELVDPFKVEVPEPANPIVEDASGGVVGLIVGGVSIIVQQIETAIKNAKQIAPPENIDISPYKAMSNQLVNGTSQSMLAGTELAPIVASTIVALQPYISQLKPYLNGTSGVSSSQNDIVNHTDPNSMSSQLQRTNADSSNSWGGLTSLSYSMGGASGMMTDPSGGSYSGNAVSAVNYWSQQYGVPAYIGQAIAMAESSMNPDEDVIDTNGQHSTGLFQLNQAGQGAGHSVDDLKNPMLNAKIGMQAIANAYHKAPPGLSGPDLAEWVAENSGHPGYGVHSGLDDTIKGYAQQILGGTIKFQPAAVTVTVKNGETKQVTALINAEHPPLGHAM